MWRLSDPKVFAALARSRSRVRTGPFTISRVEGDPAEPPRVAYAIAKRVGGAVARNRLKRRLRVAVATAAPGPGAYLVSASPAATSLSFEELLALVVEGFHALSSAPAMASR